MCVNCRVITEHECLCGRKVRASGYCTGGHRVVFAGEEQLYTGDQVVTYPRPVDVPGAA